MLWCCQKSHSTEAVAERKRKKGVEELPFLPPSLNRKEPVVLVVPVPSPGTREEWVEICACSSEWKLEDFIVLMLLPCHNSVQGLKHRWRTLCQQFQHLINVKECNTACCQAPCVYRSHSGDQEWGCIASIALSVDLNFHFFNECSFFLWSNKTWEVTESCKQLVTFWWHEIRLGLSLLGLEWYLVAIPGSQCGGMWWDCTPKLTVLYTGRTGEVHTFYTSQPRFLSCAVLLVTSCVMLA